MAIIFNCPGCGSRMQAPEALAGQKARCPSCQLVVEVPQQVLEAESTPAYPPPQQFPPSVPPLPRGVRPQGFAFRDEPELEEGERRPCPMCGEMIVAGAAKCRFCGEVFDPTLRGAGAGRRGGYTHQMHSLMNGAGGLWIFLGVLALVGILAVAGGGGGGGLGAGRLPEEVLLIAGLVAMCWLVFGICTCLKQIWAVYAGLVLSYLTVALNVINLLGSLGAGGGPQLCGIIFALCLIVAGIIQAHRIISISGQMNRRY